MAQTLDEARSFATLAEARAHFGLAEEDTDALPAVLACLNAAAASMEAYCRRILRQRVVDQQLDGDGGMVAYATEFPIANSPTPVIYADADGDFSTATQLSVYAGTGPRSEFDVVVDGETGELTSQFGGWPAGRKTIRVVATCGYSRDGAPDLLRAQLEIAHSLFEAVGRDPNLTSEQVLGISRSFIGGRTEAEAGHVGLPPFARRTLEGYRKPAYLS